MKKVLFIKANANEEGESRTYRIAREFVEAYKKNNPEDEIIELDLYDAGIQFLPKGKIHEFRSAALQNDRNHPILKFAYQFLEADKYVIAEPIWNLGIPAILKAYIDYVMVAGITFVYSENGPVGRCINKKALNIITRGGDYSSEVMTSMEMADKYLRNIFAFMGITDYSTLAVDRLDIKTEDTEAIVKDAIEQAKAIALNF